MRLNFTRMNEAHSLPSAGLDPTSLGFPSYIAANANAISSCRSFALSSTTLFQPLGAQQARTNCHPTLQLFGDMGA